MTKAVAANTGGHGIVPTGNSLEISRRSLLGAVAASPALALPAVAVSAEHPLVAEMRASRESANAEFWRLYSEARALEEAWDADPDNSDENWDRHSQGVHAAYERALMCAVFCPAAVLAKLKITGFDPAGYALPSPIKTADKVIEWDLERCAKEKLFVAKS